MLHSCPCTLNYSELHCTHLSYNRSLLYRLHTDHTVNTSHVIVISPAHTRTDSKSKSHCDWRSVSQSVSLGVEPCLGLMTRYLLLFDSNGLVYVGRPLWREDGSVFCISCWPLSAQSFSGPSPLGLATIFYCLRFDTSLFVASYDSQGHGGGIRPASKRAARRLLPSNKL
jgi:hypothetical protein